MLKLPAIFHTGKCRLKSLTGFTIIEAMVVALIAGIMAAVVIPKLGQTVDQMRLIAAGRDAALFFTYVREQAINQSRIFKVVFDTEKTSYYAQTTAEDQEKLQPDKILFRPRKFPAMLDISIAVTEDAGENTFIFNPDGTASGGSITLSNKQGRNAVVSIDDYGRIELQKR